MAQLRSCHQLWPVTLGVFVSVSPSPHIHGCQQSAGDLNQSRGEGTPRPSTYTPRLSPVSLQGPPHGTATLKSGEHGYHPCAQAPLLTQGNCKFTLSGMEEFFFFKMFFSSL